MANLHEVTIKLNYYDWEKQEYLPTPTGRIHLGNHVCRMYFDRVEDKQILVLPKEALNDGSVRLVNDYGLKVGWWVHQAEPGGGAP